MGFWDTNSINASNLNRLGPLVDGVVGTGGQYTDLYEAMTDGSGPQWNRVFVVDGATINGNVYKDGVARGCIIGVGMQSLTGTGEIRLNDCTEWHIENIRLNSTDTTAAAFTLQGSSGAYNILRRCWAYQSGYNGFYITDAQRNRLIDCRAYDCDHSGVNISATVGITWIRGLYSSNNDINGIDDRGSSTHLTDSIIVSNTGDQIDASDETYYSNNQTSI